MIPSFTFCVFILSYPVSLFLHLNRSQYNRREDFQKRTISSTLTIRLHVDEGQTRIVQEETEEAKVVMK